MTGWQELVERARGGGLEPRLALQSEIRRSLAGGEEAHAVLLGFLRTADARAWIELDQAMRASGYHERRARSTSWWARALRAARASRSAVPPLLAATGAVARQLGARADELDGARLWELAAAPHAHQRRAAYHLLRRRTPSERIEADLVGAGEDDERLRQDALDDLRSWLRLRAATAGLIERAIRLRLSRRLAAVEQHLSAEEAALLRFHAALRAEDLRP